MLNLRKFYSDNLRKMSDNTKDVKSADIASASQTTDSDVEKMIQSDDVLKTIGTQCGGDYIDEENIVVGKLTFSPIHIVFQEETIENMEEGVENQVCDYFFYLNISVFWCI